jgi:hypothetical protein
MTGLIFVLGALLGLLMGALLCIRFIRQEVAADLGPKLQRIQAQLDTLTAEMTLIAGARYAELTARISQDPRGQIN